MFREYSPAQGRWVRPDPAGLAAVSMTNPQSWNRYVYANNMPCEAIDAFGLCTIQLQIEGDSNFSGFFQGLADYLNGYLAPFDTNVAINSGAQADYVLRIMTGSTDRSLLPAGAPTSLTALGYTMPLGPRFISNKGFIFADRFVTAYAVNSSLGRVDMQTGFNRLASHELSHFLLNTADSERASVGILSQGFDVFDPTVNRYNPSDAQLFGIARKCSTVLHRAGGGGGGFGGPGFGGTAPGAQLWVSGVWGGEMGMSFYYSLFWVPYGFSSGWPGPRRK